MNAKVSVYLDLLRVVAAFLVLFSHIAPHAHTLLILEKYGHVAVMLFFVLSGYVIAYVADTREKTFETYMAHRMARLYSVVLPAMVLTFTLDTIGVRLYRPAYGPYADIDHPVIRWFIHGAFLQEVWFISVKFFTNSPLWSLGYEFWYYAMFGLAALYKGPLRRTLLAACGLMVGPVVLVYGLIWMLGHAAYRVHRHDAVSIGPAGWTAAFWISLLVLAAHPWWSPYLNTGFEIYDKPHISQIQADFVFAFFTFVNIVAVKYARLGMGAGAGFGVKAIRWWAGISFSLYAFHYPVQIFLEAVNKRYIGLHGAALFAALTVVILLVVYALSFISERQKKRYVPLFEALLAGAEAAAKKILAFRRRGQ